MRVFVTGGSGFVGGHVCERLVERGDHVGAMARSEGSADAVRAFGAEPVRCSLTDVAVEHLEGFDAVVHAAAHVEEWGPRERFWEINVEGTRRMLDAARAAGVRRFVHIGTEAALFDGHDLIDVDEAHPYPARQRFLYSETKAEAERLVLEANDDDFISISLRPRLVWGPRDTTIVPVIARMVDSGDFAWIDGGHKLTSTCHVRNLVRGVELALEHEDAGGRAYFLADDGTRTIREFLTALMKAQGVELPSRSIPGFVVRPIASLAEGVWSLLGKESAPPITRFAANMMSAEITVDTTRARKELDYEPVIDVESGLAELAHS